MGNSKRAAAGQQEEDGERAGAALERLRDPSRVLALSDGVFAIIMTLLVLDIRVPHLAGAGSLASALHRLRPSLTAFAISFIVAGMYWVGHRDLFGLIRRADRGLVWLNIVYLLPLCLLPFGAGLLGRYDREPAALRIYGLILVMSAVMRVAIWLYATGRPHLLWQRLDHRQRRAGLALTVTPGLIFGLAVLIAATAPAVSLAIYAIMPVLYFLSITILRGSKRRNREYADFS